MDPGYIVKIVRLGFHNPVKRIVYGGECIQNENWDPKELKPYPSLWLYTISTGKWVIYSLPDVVSRYTRCQVIASFENAVVISVEGTCKEVVLFVGSPTVHPNKWKMLSNPGFSSIGLACLGRSSTGMPVLFITSRDNEMKRYCFETDSWAVVPLPLTREKIMHDRRPIWCGDMLYVCFDIVYEEYQLGVWEYDIGRNNWRKLQLAKGVADYRSYLVESNGTLVLYCQWQFVNKTQYRNVMLELKEGRFIFRELWWSRAKNADYIKDPVDDFFGTGDAYYLENLDYSLVRYSKSDNRCRRLSAKHGGDSRYFYNSGRGDAFPHFNCHEVFLY